MFEISADLLRLLNDNCLRWVVTLLHFLWQGTLIGVIVLIANRTLHCRSAASRYMVNTAALLCMPLIVVLTFVCVDPAALRRPTSEPSPPIAVDKSVGVQESNTIDEMRAITRPAVMPSSPEASFAGGLTNSGGTPRAMWNQRSRRLLGVLALPVSLLYVIVATCLLLRLVRALSGGHRLRLSAQDVTDPVILRIINNQVRRLGLKSVPRVGYCESVAVPTVVGIFRPVVLLPLSIMGIDATVLTAVVCHELAHIRRHDMLINLLQRVVEALIFFHPVTWYVSRRMSAERELCCDDLVLSTGVGRLHYARALLDVADVSLTAASRETTALAAAGNDPSEFELRVERLINSPAKRQMRLSRSGVWSTLVFGLLTVAALGVLQAWASAESDVRPPAAGSTVTPANQPTGIGKSLTPPSDQQIAQAELPAVRSAVPTPTHPVSVQCVDMQGEPVAGAEVHLFQHFGQGRDARHLHFGPLMSNAEGKVRFPKAVFSGPFGNFDRYVYARIAGELVGVGHSGRSIYDGDVINPELQVRMVPSRTVEGKVDVPDGFDPRNVKVVVRTMYVMSGKGARPYVTFPRSNRFPGLDTSLPQVFERRPNADGRFQFQDVPVRGRLYLITQGEGLGEAQWWNNSKNMTFDDPIELKIAKEKKLIGRVLSPTGTPVADINVRAQMLPSEDSYFLSTFSSVTNAAGEFHLLGLPATKFTVSASDPLQRWVVRPKVNVRSTTDQGKRLTFTMEKGAHVSGKVVDAKGKPVEAAGLVAVTDTQLTGADLDSDMTDRDGAFELRVPAGRTRIYFGSLPEGFKYPPARRLDVQSSIKDMEFVISKNARAD